MEQANLSPNLSREQMKVLAEVYALTGLNDKPETLENIKEFINEIFVVGFNLKWAWKTPGFPFITLNDIYKEISGKDHPTFLNLFGRSFINGLFKDYSIAANPADEDIEAASPVSKKFTSWSSIKYLEFKEGALFADMIL